MIKMCGCVSSVPVSASINDEIREVEHMTWRENKHNNKVNRCEKNITSIKYG